MSETTFVLVHGAWHGAWCYQPVLPHLVRRGFGVLTLDLPGHGVHARFPSAFGTDPAAMATEPSPVSAITLADYADAVEGAVDAALAGGARRVMLVGHSMAGIVLTAVAERAPQKLAGLVYLAAFMPMPGVPMTEYVRCAENAGEEVAGLFCAPPPAIGAMRIDYRRADAAHRARIHSAFAHDVSAERYEAMLHLLTPDVPARPVAEPTVATAARWGRVPRAYIRCDADRAVMPALQDRFIREADAMTPDNPTWVETLAASHSPFLSMPAALAAVLARCADMCPPRP